MMAVWYLMAVCSRTVNYTGGEIGKGKGSPHSLVVVGRQWGQRITVSWAKSMKGRAHSSLLAVIFFPDLKNGTHHERYTQSPAERSRIRTRNLMYNSYMLLNLYWEIFGTSSYGEGRTSLRHERVPYICQYRFNYLFIIYPNINETIYCCLSLQV